MASRLYCASPTAMSGAMRRSEAPVADIHVTLK